MYTCGEMIISMFSQNMYAFIKRDLFFSLEEVESYKLIVGIAKLVAPPLETPEMLVERMKREGVSDTKIAGHLIEKYDRITNFRLGVLLPANPGANIEPGSHKRRGKRLRAGV